MNHEETSHYQSGTFIGIKWSRAGLRERCGKTKENDFFG